MFQHRSAAVLIAGAVIFGAGLFIAAGLSGAGETGAAGQVRTIKPTQKLEPVKAAVAVQAVPKALGNPVAYGFVQFNGSVSATSGNFSVEWNASSGRYYIRIAGVSYSRGPYITFVTPEGNGGIYVPATWEDNGALVICIGDITGSSSTQAGFQFVTYKVN
jgi:hypothetical protein